MKVTYSMSQSSSSSDSPRRARRRNPNFIHQCVGETRPRPREWVGLTVREILDLHPKVKTHPLKVLKILIELCNGAHTSIRKTVSYKTQHDRAHFLRSFFLQLQTRAGFPTMPDPRNLGQQHIQAMVDIWRADKLAPGTYQTYLSHLRGLALWLGKSGLVRTASYYGLAPEEYRRSECADHDKSWTAKQVDVLAVLNDIHQFDPHVGAALHLCHAFGLRVKEAVMLQPHSCIVLREETPASVAERATADEYLFIRRGSKGGRPRWIPCATERQRDALALARSLVTSREGHVGDPARELKQNLFRLYYVVKKFGVTKAQLGMTSHGLRHQRMNDEYERLTGEPSPVRGGREVPREVDLAARKEIVELAGHSRVYVAGAYLGGILNARRTAAKKNAAPGAMVDASMTTLAHSVLPDSPDDEVMEHDHVDTEGSQMPRPASAEPSSAQKTAFD